MAKQNQLFLFIASLLLTINPVDVFQKMQGKIQGLRQRNELVFGKAGASAMEIVVFLLFVITISVVLFLLRDQIVSFVNAVKDKVAGFTSEVG